MLSKIGHSYLHLVNDQKKGLNFVLEKIPFYRVKYFGQIVKIIYQSCFMVTSVSIYGLS